MIKINEFPADAKTVANGWKEFTIDIGGREITVTVRPKMFNKLEQAHQQYPSWVGYYWQNWEGNREKIRAG
ncbi:MAG: hypothetical protein AB1489_15580 [Acidobacteriota bacterium]